MSGGSNLPPNLHRGGRDICIHWAAKVIGRSERTIRRWAQQGKLRAYRNGRRSWRINRMDVEFIREVRGFDA